MRSRPAAAVGFVGGAVVGGLGVLTLLAWPGQPPEPAPAVAASAPAVRPGASDPADAGVPEGTVLTAAEGLTVTEDGTVLEDLDIEGCVVVEADDVVIRRSRVACESESAVVQVTSDARGLVVENSEIDGLGRTSTCVASHDFTLVAVEVHSCADGIRANSRTTVLYSRVHSLTRIGDSHNDAVQTTQGTEIELRGNLFEATDVDGGLLNAAYILAGDQGPVAGVVLEDNVLQGGNYALMVGPGVQGLSVEDNTFTGPFRYGPVRGVGPGEADVTWAGNTVDGQELARS